MKTPPISHFILLVLFLISFACTELQAQGQGPRGQRRNRQAPAQNATPTQTGDDQVVLVPGPVPNLADSAEENRPLGIVAPGELQSLAPVVPAKVVQYASYIFNKYDTNGDGVLQREEWEKMPGAPQSMNVNNNFEITLEEFVRFIALYGKDRTIHRPNPPVQVRQQNIDWSLYSTFQPLGSATPPKREEGQQPAANAEQGQDPTTLEEGWVGESAEEGTEISDDDLDNLSYEQIISGKYQPSERKYYRPLSDLRGVPNWFIAKDKNGDGQLSMIEFDPNLTPEGLRAFGIFDKNGDGFITIDEVLQQGQ